MSGPSKAEIWLVDLRGRGHEQKNARPGIIWRDLDHVKMAIVIPCTATEGSEKFPHTLLISSTSKNGLGKDSIALLFQITTIDKQRLIKKLGELDQEDIASIVSILKDMLRL